MSCCIPAPGFMVCSRQLQLHHSRVPAACSYNQGFLRLYLLHCNHLHTLVFLYLVTAWSLGAADTLRLFDIMIYPISPQRLPVLPLLIAVPSIAFVIPHLCAPEPSSSFQLKPNKLPSSSWTCH